MRFVDEFNQIRTLKLTQKGQVKNYKCTQYS